MPKVDVLIPTCNRPGGLAVTLACLIGQRFDDFRVLVSDQSDGPASYDDACAQATLRVLAAMGRSVRMWRNLPPRGLAQQRQALLDAATAPYVLYLDDDVILEPQALERLVTAMDHAACGFVGSAVIGLSYRDDVRPEQQDVTFWPDNVVLPEDVRPGTRAWNRHVLHSAANLWHVQSAHHNEDTAADTWRAYKIAWVGGCVLYDRKKLVDAGGFTFWKDAPAAHCGEDVYAQLRVMRRYGGCGIMPSGAFHQELPTTVTDRRVDLPIWFDTAQAQTCSTQ